MAFPQFVGINFIFNQYFSTTYSGYGTPATSLAIDGQTRTYRMTWIADDGWLTQTLLAHEMGHTWGLGHSSGPYDEVYDSRWDVMSGGSTCTPYDKLGGCVAAHTITYHKHLLGWTPPEHRSIITVSGTYTFSLG